LDATIESLSQNTLAHSTVICLACEERDPTAISTFASLEAKYEHYFRGFVMSSHRIQPGEVAGKSSNENVAVREIYKYTQRESLDPFRVMVTVCDADSLFDTVFLEQLEAEFWRMPDGRRVLYDSPINTYRNLPECNLIVRAFEVSRCQDNLFSGMGFRPAQSNYSLTLGFAHEIDYWDPTNTSEDYHTTLKAMAFSGNGRNVVVRVWSLILNDSVCSFKDRWVQAKRHMWGIEEVAWVWSLFPVLRLNHWLTMLALSAGQMLTGSVVPSSLMYLFPPIQKVLFSLHRETQLLLVALFATTQAYMWTKTIIREVFLYRYILNRRKHFMRPSLGYWIMLVTVYPVLNTIAWMAYNVFASWAMVLRAQKHHSVVYVTAPKALNSSSEPSEKKERHFTRATV
jgi:hypothetical protein